MFVPGVCYGDTGSEVETEGNGMLQCRVGSLFTGRNSFHPGEPREGLAGLPTGWSHPHTNCYEVSVYFLIIRLFLFCFFVQHFSCVRDFKTTISIHSTGPPSLCYNKSKHSHSGELNVYQYVFVYVFISFYSNTV